MENKRVGRPGVDDDLKRKNFTITLNQVEAQALRELSRIRRRSLGIVAGDLFLRELDREQKRAKK